MLTEEALEQFRIYNQKNEVREAIKAIRTYIALLVDMEEIETDITDKLPYESMILELSMAIKNLEHCSKMVKEEEEPIKLTTSVYSPSAIKSLPTNYLPGSTCFVLQDASFYILDTNHEWVQLGSI
jgi:hypothetical protein